MPWWSDPSASGLRAAGHSTVEVVGPGDREREKEREKESGQLLKTCISPETYH